MKGKNVFTQSEYEDLESLVIQRPSASKGEQKKVRKEMRRIGFYGGDDFGIKDLRIDDLRNLRRSGRIVVVDSKFATMPTPKSSVCSSVKQDKPAITIMCDGGLKSWVETGVFKAVSSLQEADIPNKPGLYCIKLREGISMPAPFDQYSKNRNNIIYIGKASQSIRQRLWNQELHHKSAATFFRSLGAVLGYRPGFGSLKGKGNQNNYKFTEADKQSIIAWIEQNLEVRWICVTDDNLDKLETDLIHKYTPIFNIKKNPATVPELIQLREECIQIARG